MRAIWLFALTLCLASLPAQGFQVSRIKADSTPATLVDKPFVDPTDQATDTLDLPMVATPAPPPIGTDSLATYQVLIPAAAFPQAHLGNQFGIDSLPADQPLRAAIDSQAPAAANAPSDSPAPDTTAAPASKSRTATSSTPSSQKLSPSSRAFWLEQYTTGRNWHIFGRVLCWGGVAGQVFGTLTASSNVILLSSATLMVGVPVVGLGATTMIAASNDLHPKFPREMNGWGAYGTSWALMGGGLLAVTTSITQHDPNIPILFLGAASLVVGGICQYVAWARFSASADQAASVVRPQAVSLELLPAVYVQNQHLLPGMQLAMRF